MIITPASNQASLDRRQLKRLLWWQLILALGCQVLALPFGIAVTISVAIGAGACITANWLHAWWVFRDYRASRPGAVAGRMYAGEIIKIVVVLLIFGFAFASIDELNLPALLLTYFAVQVVPALLASRPTAGGNESDSTQ